MIIKKNTFMISVIFLILLNSTKTVYSVIYTTDYDLIGYWKQDDSEAPYIDSKDNQIPDITMGVGVGNPTEQKPPLAPYSTYSIKYDGDPSVDAITNDTASMRAIIQSMSTGVKGFTVGCWINSTRAVGDTEKAFGTSYYDGTVKWNGWDIGVYSSGYYTVEYRSSAGGSGHLETIQTYEPNAKVQLTAKFNATGVSTYVNGTYNSAEPYDVTLSQNGNFYLSIGATWYNSQWSQEEFYGFVDECWIMNRTLTDTEIMEIYTNGIQNPPILAEAWQDIMLYNYNNTHLSWNRSICVANFYDIEKSYDIPSLSGWTLQNGADPLVISSYNKNCTTYINVTTRPMYDEMITISSVTLGNEITTNTYSIGNLIDPPHAFSKDGMADCSFNTTINSEMDINHTIKFFNTGTFNVNSRLLVDGIEKNDTLCKVAINSGGRIEIN